MSGKNPNNAHMKGRTFKNYYFLGIGGIGMSALARYFKFEGFNVAGYDRSSSKVTDDLQAEGISVVFDETIKAIGFCRQ